MNARFLQKCPGLGCPGRIGHKEDQLEAKEHWSEGSVETGRPRVDRKPVPTWARVFACRSARLGLILESYLLISSRFRVSKLNEIKHLEAQANHCAGAQTA